VLGAFRNDAPAGVSVKASEPRYYVGVNLGQSRDPTPIAVVRRVDPSRPLPEKEKPKPNYARGSVEWQEEQRRQSEAASGVTIDVWASAPGSAKRLKLGVEGHDDFRSYLMQSCNPLIRLAQAKCTKVLIYEHYHKRFMRGSRGCRGAEPGGQSATNPDDVD
jgi:hypothetical protein